MKGETPHQSSVVCDGVASEVQGLDGDVLGDRSRQDLDVKVIELAAFEGQRRAMAVLQRVLHRYDGLQGQGFVVHVQNLKEEEVRVIKKRRIGQP